MIKLKGRVFGAAAVVTAVCVITVAGSALATSVLGVSNTEPVVASSSVGPVTGPSALQQRMLSAFRASPSRMDKPPGDVVDWRAKAQGGDPAAGRLVDITATGTHVYMIPALGGVCTVSDSYLFNTCSTDAEISEGNSIQGVACSPYMDPNTITIYGIVSDGLRHVTVVFANGTRQAAPVRNNFFVYEGAKTTAEVTSVTWNDVAGVHTFHPLPPHVNALRCESLVSPTAASAWARGHEPTGPSNPGP